MLHLRVPRWLGGLRRARERFCLLRERPASSFPKYPDTTATTTSTTTITTLYHNRHSDQNTHTYLPNCCLEPRYPVTHVVPHQAAHPPVFRPRDPARLPLVPQECRKPALFVCPGNLAVVPRRSYIFSRAVVRQRPPELARCRCGVHSYGLQLGCLQRLVHGPFCALNGSNGRIPDSSPLRYGDSSPPRNDRTPRASGIPGSSASVLRSRYPMAFDRGAGLIC